ncbi:MAG: peptidylprolyl isomerase [Elusimicrobia bacterium]|nr:peptidylprolyl isomerase [Elusimicrobiota bacterium]MBK7545877.1 peptidylprolyl isomerase [Elusimicrobiota bacterium]MBK7575141.1 peptidylprolyl isomerase [Elusimicrobiota bacterium]MBK7687595.1 peptidylprolyl isomerase [Elusimicrobiota bacterium]MBK8125487.1 peptidylprolyl isomerase [Elusimicrobiota bacterium]
MKRNALSLILLSAAATGVVAATLTNRPIAIINGETILLSDFQKNWTAFQEQQKERQPEEKMDAAGKAKIQRELFEQMIDDKVLLSEAKKRKVKVPQREFETGLLQFKAQFLSPAAQKELQAILRRQAGAQDPEHATPPDLTLAWKELEKANPSAVKEALALFKKELVKEGLDEKKFQDKIRDRLSVIQLSREEVQRRTEPPTETDVKSLFERLTNKMKGKTLAGLAEEDAKDLDAMAKFFNMRNAERVRARHILVGPLDVAGRPDGWEALPADKKAAFRKTLSDLRKKIQAGAEFGDLAKEHSIDKATGARGGDLGFFARGQMVPPFEKAAFALPVGGLSDLVETRFGLHLIQVVEKKAATKLAFEDAEDDLRDYLFQAAQQKSFEALTDELRKTADVKVLVKPEELSDL